MKLSSGGSVIQSDYLSDFHSNLLDQVIFAVTDGISAELRWVRETQVPTIRYPKVHLCVRCGKFNLILDFANNATPLFQFPFQLQACLAVDKQLANCSPTELTRYGFLSVVEVPRLGYCGGLLVLTPVGRPLEFHCTAPVTANRAQQILYGQTLKQFLVCDQIAAALVQKTQSRPGLMLVDDMALLMLSELISQPVVWVDCNSADDEKACAFNLELEGQRFFVQGNLGEQVEPMLNVFAQTLPVTEPFERIHQAINEALAEAA